MQIKTLVFDFGKVVGLFDHHLTTKRLVAYAGLPADELHAHLYGGPLEEEYECGKITTAEFLCRVRQTCRLTCSNEVIATAWADIFSPNHEVCALVPRLKPHYRLLLASNTNELHAEQFCRQLADTLRFFDAIVLSHKIGVRKPRAEFFHHCQRLAGCAAEECLFIDDLPGNVAGAIACGWNAIVFTDTTDLLKRFAAFGIKGLASRENAAQR
jgi:glucose-1-phosphatase